MTGIPLRRRDDPLFDHGHALPVRHLERLSAVLETSDDDKNTGNDGSHQANEDEPLTLHLPSVSDD
jgi:hypothetical protein